MRGYIISMSVRTACFVLAILVYLTLGWMWPALALMAGAVVLPYYAVVLANASANRQSHFMEPASPVREIGTAEDQHRSPGPGEHW